MKNRYTKTILAMSLALFTAAFSCAGSFCAEAEEQTSVLRSFETTPTSGNVKLLGRTVYQGNILYLANSGSGIEFTFFGDHASLDLVGDSTTAEGGNPKWLTRIAVYVNGQKTQDQLISSQSTRLDLVNSEAPGLFTVRVVKLSEPAFSIFGIRSVQVNATGPSQPTAGKRRLIEFIGDSITCGYGLDDPDLTHTFSTATEDAAGSYAYQACEAMDYDISMLSYSGCGILPGNEVISGLQTSMPKTISQYYNKLAFSNSSIGMIYPQLLRWDFEKKADIVVINLGTNDWKYITSGLNTTEEFEERYVEFLGKIREQNPEAMILCTLGIMGDELYPNIENAVRTFKKDTNDQFTFTMKFNRQSEEDGYVIGGHPSRAANKKAAEQLVNTIREYERQYIW